MLLQTLEQEQGENSSSDMGALTESFDEETDDGTVRNFHQEDTETLGENTTTETGSSHQDEPLDTVDMNLELGAKKDVRVSQGSDGLCFVNSKAASTKLSDMKQPNLAPDTSHGSLITSSSGDHDDYKQLHLPDIPGSPLTQEQQALAKHKQIEVYSDRKKETVGSKTDSKSDSKPTTKSLSEAASKPVESKPINLNSSSKAADKTTSKPKTSKSQSQKDALRPVDANKHESKRSSFFRRLSTHGKSGKENVSDDVSSRKSSFSLMFKRLFSPSSQKTEILLSTLDEQELYEAIRSLFTEWKKHGISKLFCDENFRRISAEVSKGNVLCLKPCKFVCRIVSEDDKWKPEAHSRAIFTNDSGSIKTFRKMVHEFRIILNKEGVYVE